MCEGTINILLLLIALFSFNFCNDFIKTCYSKILSNLWARISFANTISSIWIYQITVRIDSVNNFVSKRGINEN